MAYIITLIYVAGFVYLLLDDIKKSKTAHKR